MKLEESYRPDVPLDATKLEIIAATFPKRHHRLSDYNFRHVVNSDLSAADRGEKYPSKLE